MLGTLVLRSFQRRRRPALAAIAAVVLGASLASAMAGLSLDVADKMGREMRAYGANILLVPKDPAAHLEEKDLPKLKAIFWRHNVVGFAPFLGESVNVSAHNATRRATLTGTWLERNLTLEGGTLSWLGGKRSATEGPAVFAAGLRRTSPWWKDVENWSRGEGVVGGELARAMGVGPGDEIEVEYGGRALPLRVSGVIETGGEEDGQVFVELAVAQELLRLPGLVDRVLVSALVKPEDDLSRKDHGAMSGEEHERWYCSPYLSSVTYQMEEALEGAAARPIRRVAEAEGRFVGRMQSLMGGLALAAVAASSLGVLSTMTVTVAGRREEVGLARALGATRSQLAKQFLAEGALIGLAGGIAGFVAGLLLADSMSARLFGSPFMSGLAVLPLAMAASVAVALAGWAIPLVRLLRAPPARTLRGEW